MKLKQKIPTKKVPTTTREQRIKMMKLPIEPIKRIIKKQIPQKNRVSHEAGIELGIILEDHGIEITKIALDIMEQNGKKTLKKEYIQRAYDIWKTENQ